MYIYNNYAVLLGSKAEILIESLESKQKERNIYIV